MNKQSDNIPTCKKHIFSIIFSVICMSSALGVSYIYHRIQPDHYTNISLIFLLALVLIGRFTKGYGYSIVCSVCAILLINWVFTYPFFLINFSIEGYPFVFLIMLGISLVISTMTTRLVKQQDMIAQGKQQLAEAEMERMRANLLRAISHDLRTPLTGIIGNSSLLLDDLESSKMLSSEDQKNLLHNIHDDSYGLLAMVENLLTVTRIQGENFKINTTLEMAEEIIGAAVRKFQNRYPQASVKVTYPEDIILLPMDPILIKQVTLNLLENAVHHSNSQKPINFLVENCPDHVSFTIRDYGKGIPPALLPHLFDGTAYFAASQGDSHKGMGIGLSICKTIITAHNGTLVGRNHSEGAEFIFTLPKDTDSRIG